MIGPRHVATAALALGTVLLATTALQGAYAQARGEGLPPIAGSQANPNLADPDVAADLDAAEPSAGSPRGPFVPGSNPDGGKRFTGQQRLPSPGFGAPPSKTGQPTPSVAQRFPGGGPAPTTSAATRPKPGVPYAGSGYVPPSASKKPITGTPAAYGSATTPGGAQTAPYKPRPYGTYADDNGYQDGYARYPGGDGYQGGYGRYRYGNHQHDCP